LNLFDIESTAMRTILIGVTGASSSGKSTLAYLLKSVLPNTEIIHEDDFFKLEKDVPFDPARNDRDWDCPDAIDMDSMRETLLVLKDPKNFKTNSNAKVKLGLNGDYDYSIISTEPIHKDVNFNNDTETLENLQKPIQEVTKKYENGEKFRIYLLDGFLLLHDLDLVKLFDLSIFFKTSYQTLKFRREKRLYTVEGNIWVDPPGYFDLFVWPAYYKYHKDLFIKGDDEPYIKLTGGQLLPEFKEKFNVFEFDNNDNSEGNVLLENVVNVIIQQLFL
jgi:nicotinamide/nicotinate riboside kinase